MYSHPWLVIFTLHVIASVVLVSSMSGCSQPSTALDLNEPSATGVQHLVRTFELSQKHPRDDELDIEFATIRENGDLLLKHNGRLKTVRGGDYVSGFGTRGLLVESVDVDSQSATLRHTKAATFDSAFDELFDE